MSWELCFLFGWFFSILREGRIYFFFFNYYSFGISSNGLLPGVILGVSCVGPGVGVDPDGSLQLCIFCDSKLSFFVSNWHNTVVGRV